MVIVTQNQYILASKIHHITMDEQISHEEVRINNKYSTVKSKYYQITVIYSPDMSQNQHNNGRHDETRECSVIIRGAVNAHLVFKNLIQQIREQMPDQLYLDKALENMLAGVDLPALADKDKDDEFQLEEKHVVRSPKAIRKPRKTKGRGKAVLRAAKRSGGKRR